MGNLGKNSVIRRKHQITEKLKDAEGPLILLSETIARDIDINNKNTLTTDPLGKIYVQCKKLINSIREVRKTRSQQDFGSPSPLP